MALRREDEMVVRNHLRVAEEEGRVNERIPIHLCFELDVSGSMRAADVKSAVDEADLVIDSQRGGPASNRTYVTFVTFNQVGRVVIPPTLVNDCPKVASLGLYGDGGTSMFEPTAQLLTMYREELAPTSRLFFRVLSDGQSEQRGMMECQEAARVAQEAGVECIALAYGTGLTKEQLAESLGFSLAKAVSAEKDNPYAMVLASQNAIATIDAMAAQTTTDWSSSVE